MALTAKHNTDVFGIGDRIKVTQIVDESGKKRSQVFEGIVIAIKGREKNKSFTVRRIGVGQVGIERIFPIYSPILEKIEVVREGLKGVKRAKLYYIREQSKKEIEKIYTKAKARDNKGGKVKEGGKKASGKKIKK